MLDIAFDTTVDAQEVDSYDENQDPTYKSKRSISCRVDWGSEVVRGPDGSVLDYKDVIVTHDEVTTDDRFYLPGESKPRHPSNVKKSKIPGSSKFIYEVVL